MSHLVFLNTNSIEENRPWFAHSEREELIIYTYFYLLQHLVTSYNTDPYIKWLLDNTRIHLMPSMNPDGYAISREGQCDTVLGRFVSHSQSGSGKQTPRGHIETVDYVISQFSHFSHFYWVWELHYILNVENSQKCCLVFNPLKLNNISAIV